jgi:hypothetical protein
LTNGGTYNDGAWHHAAAVIDRSLGKILLYVDGALANSTAFTTSWDLTTAGGQAFTLGGYSGATPNLTGSLDDARVYNRALSAAEINQIYASPAATYTRYFYVSDVYRTAGMIVTSGGTYDPSTKLVTVVYQLPYGATSSFAEYLTRHGQKIYDQTNWSGGGGANGPATTTSGQFSTSSGINYTTSTGSIYVAIPGY